MTQQFYFWVFIWRKWNPSPGETPAPPLRKGIIRNSQLMENNLMSTNE